MTRVDYTSHCDSIARDAVKAAAVELHWKGTFMFIHMFISILIHTRIRMHTHAHPCTYIPCPRTHTPIPCTGVSSGRVDCWWLDGSRSHNVALLQSLLEAAAPVGRKIRRPPLNE